MKSRNSNIELLRIFAIVAITLYHIRVWGGVTDYDVSFNKYLLDVLSMYGKIGVNVFVLISGYYGIKEHFNLRKILKIECETLFVSCLLYIISFFWRFAHGVQLDKIGMLKEGIKCVFPTIFGSYWYSAAFIILCFLKPFINKMVNALDKIQLRGLIIVLLIIWCIIPTFTLQIGSGYGWSNYLWMPVPYLIGCYIRIYQRSFIISKNKLLWIFTGTNVLHLFPTVLFNSVLDGKLNWLSYYLCNSNSITSVIISVALLLMVVDTKERSHKIINFIATGVFSCYLIQEHIVFRDILWNEIVNMPLNQNNNYLILLLIITIASLLVLGILSHKICDILENKCLNKVFENSNWLEDFLDRKVYGYYD